MKRIDDVWDACPEGELLRLATALRTTYRIRILSRAAAAIAIVIACLTAATFLAPALMR